MTTARALRDSGIIVWRQLVQLPRIPEVLIFSLIQPVMFVLLFRYVFGGAIATPGESYVNYLMPGIFAQTVAFGAVASGIGLAEDLRRGIIDRFRSLPMARSAVLVGRTASDLVRNAVVVGVMYAVGLAVGFRPEGSIGAQLV
ncbi:MAG: ABC transporter permease, partial [Miltoncostaeaceae bacterium]